MTSSYKRILAGAVALLLTVFIATAAAENQTSYESGRANLSVPATITSPGYINSVPHPISASKPQRKYHKDPYVPDPAELAKLKVEDYDPANPRHILDRAAGEKDAAALFEPCQSFLGITNTGWNPPDPSVAVGPDHIVAVVNSSIAVYDKQTGNQLLQTTASFWFQNTSPPPPSSFIFDPKVVYDPNPGRFVIFFLCTDDVDESSFLVSASASSDAMGSWYSYNLDATLNGSTPANTWPDYPGLGFDYDEAVYLTSNMWLFDGGFLYSKVRILDKDSLYSGGEIIWNDLWNLRYNNFSTAFTIKPAETYSDADGEFLLSNIWYGATYTTYWKITDPLGAPVATLRPQVSVPSYSQPPEATQLGGSPTLSLVGPMTQEVVYRNGMVYTSFSQSFNWGLQTVAAVRMLGIDTATSTAAFDAVYGADGVHYYFPAIYVDPEDRIHATFSRSSDEEYISVHYVEDFVNDPTSKLLKAGEGHRGGSSPTRWGDYGAIAPDPVDQNQVWVLHEYPSSSGSWRTWIGRFPSKIGQPALATPADAEQVETPVELSWDLDGAATEYLLQVSLTESFIAPAFQTTVSGNSYELSGLDDLTKYFWRVQGVSECEDVSWSPTRSFTVCDFLAGDADGNDLVNITDAVFLISYIFSGGVAPSPLNIGDADCNGLVNITDAVYLISYIFNDGPAPCKECQAD